MTDAKIDALDRKLLDALQRRGRLSAQELADETGQSAPATCWRRLKSLTDIGLIKGYHASLDREKLGYHICAFVHVSIERQNKDVIEEFEKKVLDRPEVQECYATTGEADYTLRVIAKDIRDYDTFMQRFLFELPGVSHVETSIALREVKQSANVPLND